jgi:hypothetical protein
MDEMIVRWVDMNGGINGLTRKSLERGRITREGETIHVIEERMSTDVKRYDSSEYVTEKSIKLSPHESFKNSKVTSKVQSPSHSHKLASDYRGVEPDANSSQA